MTLAVWLLVSAALFVGVGSPNVLEATLLPVVVLDEEDSSAGAVFSVSRFSLSFGLLAVVVVSSFFNASTNGVFHAFVGGRDTFPASAGVSSCMALVGGGDFEVATLGAAILLVDGFILRGAVSADWGGFFTSGSFRAGNSCDFSTGLTTEGDAGGSSNGFTLRGGFPLKFFAYMPLSSDPIILFLEGGDFRGSVFSVTGNRTVRLSFAESLLELMRFLFRRSCCCCLSRADDCSLPFLFLRFRTSDCDVDVEFGDGSMSERALGGEDGCGGEIPFDLFCLSVPPATEEKVKVSPTGRELRVSFLLLECEGGWVSCFLAFNCLAILSAKAFPLAFPFFFPLPLVVT
mmetsp:Transcript_5891/g.22350  ORF Transcript_5891/g.22350 Transcript_5891/m.22350 type:complete len:346 (-) Transcript_5891:2058-3095(-)